MSDLVMLSLLAAVFVFFMMCFMTLRAIGGYFQQDQSNTDIYLLLSSQLTCVICMMLSLFNIIDYLII